MYDRNDVESFVHIFARLSIIYFILLWNLWLDNGLSSYFYQVKYFYMLGHRLVEFLIDYDPWNFFKAWYWFHQNYLPNLYLIKIFSQDFVRLQMLLDENWPIFQAVKLHQEPFGQEI